MNDEELRRSETSADAPADEPLDSPPADSTGVPAVDEVLASLHGLEERPVDEHVSVFEQAHDRLRAALSDAGRDSAAG